MKDDAAVILPSLVAPIFMRMWEPEVGPLPTNTSVRLMVILTGLADIFDSRAATGSRYTPPMPFAPKPPPISIGTTLI